MTRNRFSEMTQNLKFYDPKLAHINMLKNIKLYKFQQVFYLFKLFNKDCITLGPRLSVDETLYPYRRIFGGLQFIKARLLNMTFNIGS